MNFTPENVAELIMLGYKDTKNHAKMFERKGPKLRELLKITKLIKNRKKTNE